MSDQWQAAALALPSFPHKGNRIQHISVPAPVCVALLAAAQAAPAAAPPPPPPDVVRGDSPRLYRRHMSPASATRRHAWHPIKAT